MNHKELYAVVCGAKQCFEDFEKELRVFETVCDCGYDFRRIQAFINSQASFRPILILDIPRHFLLTKID